MAAEKISDQIRQLIQENDQRAAAELLTEAFRDKNSKLFDIAVVQLANIKKLSDLNAAGVLSFEEMNREQAKTNDSLLYLANEHARLFEGETSEPENATPGWIWKASVALVAVLGILGLLKYTGISGNAPDSFDLELRLYEPGGEQKVITEGEVNIRLGEEVPRQPQKLNEEGSVVFRELSGRYRDSVVHLLYFPTVNSRRFEISNQNAAVIKNKKRQTLRFEVAFLPDTTLFEALLRGSDQRVISGADITIDGNIHVTSDEKGYFKVPIPKASGEVANLVIEKNGKILLKQDVSVSSGFREIPIK